MTSIVSSTPIYPEQFMFDYSILLVEFRCCQFSFEAEDQATQVGFRALYRAYDGNSVDSTRSLLVTINGQRFFYLPTSFNDQVCKAKEFTL